MNLRTVVIVFAVFGWVAPAMADVPMMPGPAKIGAQCSAQQDYVAAMLTYDEQLKKNPFDHTAMKHLVSCHEAMLQNDKNVEAATFPDTARASDQNEFPDLPKFDDAIASKPQTTK